VAVGDDSNNPAVLAMFAVDFAGSIATWAYENESAHRHAERDAQGRATPARQEQLFVFVELKAHHLLAKIFPGAYLRIRNPARRIRRAWERTKARGEPASGARSRLRRGFEALAGGREMRARSREEIRLQIEGFREFPFRLFHPLIHDSEGWYERRKHLAVQPRPARRSAGDVRVLAGAIRAYRYSLGNGGFEGGFCSDKT
jgi:hypothetical protein